MSKADKKRLRQEKDPNFKNRAQTKGETADTASQNPVQQAPAKTSAETSKRKAPGIGFDMKAERSKRQKGEAPLKKQ